MVGNRRGWSGIRGEQGSSLIYVILSITLLSVFSCGYMAVSRYQMKSVLTGKYGGTDNGQDHTQHLLRGGCQREIGSSQQYLAVF